MDEPSKRNPGWQSALRIGSYHFPATFFLVLGAMILSLWVLPPLFFVFGTGWFAPFFWTMVLFSTLLLFRHRFVGHLYKNPLSDGDSALLEYLVQQNTHSHSAEEDMELELLENALHLKQVRAQDCMAPRPEIVFVDVSDPVETLRHKFVESSLSRILIVDGELDKVLGYAHVQHLFAHPADIRSIIMPITFVPESIPVNELMNKFIKNRTNIACVVDEYGSLAGLVTLEDALEQLFGEIDDEHDQEEFIAVQINENEYLFSGRLEIAYLNSLYPKLNLPEGEYNTLSGYVVLSAQTIPEQGARIELDGKLFILELVSDRKIETLRVLLPA